MDSNFKNNFIAGLVEVVLYVIVEGIGKQLIQAAYQYAIDEGYKGLSVIAQDNNLDACRFYLACGFEIGGLDTKTYEHTKQAGKADITFYKFITE